MTVKKKGIALYYQVEEEIKKKILNHEWKSGFRIPSEAELSDYFHVSRSTIRAAIAELISSGFLFSRQGSGTYVSEPSYSRKRFSQNPSDLICKYIYNPFIQNDEIFSYANILRLNEAHVLMLRNHDFLTQEETKKILEYITELKTRDSSALQFEPEYEDYYLNFEHNLIQKLGIEIAGKIGMARSRNDMIPAVTRMNARDMTFVVMQDEMRLIGQLLQMAKRYQSAVMTGYTHLQPSRPITLGFYFLAISESLLREQRHLADIFEEMNLSPLGACAFSGTGLLIDRHYYAEILGFAGIVENTLDAVASRDFLLELSSAFAAVGSLLGRFAEDLYLWSTKEYGYLELDDSVCCSSASMAQKKNPLSIEHIKSKISHLLAAYTDIFICLKGVSYQHCRDLIECTIPFQNSFQELRAVLELLMETLQRVSFCTEIMEREADRNGCAISGFAEFFVMRRGITFRIAHNIVESAVKQCISEKIEIRDMPVEILNRVAENVMGKSLHMTQEELNRMFNPHEAVEFYTSEGSPSGPSIETMLRHQVNQLEEAQERYHRNYSMVEQAYHNLEKTVQDMIKD